MNKKYVAVILSLLLIFSAIMLISGCNKDDENTVVPTGTTEIASETEQTTEDSSIEETEITTPEKETVKESESTTEADEPETEALTKPDEKPTDKDEPVTCDVCGGIITDDKNLAIGNFCDGACDEWFDM